MDSSHSPSSPKEIRILTLNCWGLKYISALRVPRVAQIAQQLASLSPAPQIVALQECFTQQDFQTIHQTTRYILPYAKFYYAGVFGGGLAILSAWPIEEGEMTTYPLNGRPSAFWRGDWYVGKGIARAKIRFGDGDKDVVEVFNTHTHAPYGTAPGSQYTAHRTSQAWLMRSQIQRAAQTGALVVSLGDFNMLPLSLAHRIISASPVRDTWRVIHPSSSLGPSSHPAEAARGLPIPTAETNLLLNGATSDSVYNTWRWNKPEQQRLSKGDPQPVDPTTPDPRGKRLDYVFASTGAEPGSKRGWVVNSVAVGMTERHPSLHVSLSDHFAVCTTLKYHDVDADVANASYEEQLQYNHKEQDALSEEVLDEILAMIHEFTAGEQRQQKWRSIHFYISVVFWIAAMVALDFTGAFAVLLAVVGSLVLLSGVIDGLIALIFFSWELRSLKEFEWQINNAKQSIRHKIL
ncbi:hypothetical protein VHEMI04044 [[Torrubiella] hemipterigena]|uniref:Endonuclease/exonuclease/phosphatase domain-containing protein n=1 Tax=[Torrubiella] hemipterigena TaxID=1531966 RepID=A0A0A1TCP4_9HYPO|nr:hypothetical protein VHEMI04044 [[Torrubiella] hemipterigena]